MRKITYSCIIPLIFIILIIYVYGIENFSDNCYNLFHKYIFLINIFISILCIFMFMYNSYHYDIKRTKYFEGVCNDIKNIFSYLPIGVFIVDDQYNIKFINDEAIKLLKIDKNIYNKKCTSFCNNICEFDNIKCSVSFEHTLVNLLDNINLCTTIIPTNFSGRNKLYIEFLYDISFRQKFLNELIETCNFKSDLISIISHEFRSPLHAIKLSLSSIIDGYSGNIDSEVKEDIEISYLGIDRLISFVDELLDMSKIENNKFEYAFEYSDLCFIIKSVVDISKYFLKNNNINCIVNCPNIISFNFDKQKMLQVFTNLINNSIKFTNPGGTILINVEKIDTAVIIEFIDNGRGVDSSFGSKIFEKFFYDNTLNLTGSGLGLFIVKSIVSAHGGVIEYESPVKGKYNDIIFDNIKKGTKFKITFPIDIFH